MFNEELRRFVGEGQLKTLQPATSRFRPPMKHQTLDQLRTVAKISTDRERFAMTRSERLERWAEILEREPNGRLATLRQTEYHPVGMRDTMHSVGSPLTVAFEDPVLRAEGLENDSYGEAKQFFELTNAQLHEIGCYCHYGEAVSAGAAARHVRAAMAPSKPGIITRVQEAITW